MKPPGPGFFFVGRVWFFFFFFFYYWLNLFTFYRSVQILFLFLNQFLVICFFKFVHVIYIAWFVDLQPFIVFSLLSDGFIRVCIASSFWLQAGRKRAGHHAKTEDDWLEWFRACARQPELPDSNTYHLLAVWPGVCYLSFLCLHFFIYKMGTMITIMPISQTCEN